jgi:hypothetical protein
MFALSAALTAAHLLGAVRLGNPAKELTIDGRQVVKIMAVDRRNPGASDVISIEATKRSIDTGVYFFE